MSGVVKQVGKIFSGGDSSSPAPSPTAPTAEKPVVRTTTPEERALAMRRRRGARSLLSEERMNAEAGLGGDQTTLGGM